MPTNRNIMLTFNEFNTLTLSLPQPVKFPG